MDRFQEGIKDTQDTLPLMECDDCEEGIYENETYFVHDSFFKTVILCGSCAAECSSSYINYNFMSYTAGE